MKKFSDELTQPQDRDFEIGGELFKWRYPYWEELTTIFDHDIASLSANGDEEKVITTQEGMKDTIQRIKIFLDPQNDSLKRWDALVKRKENAVPLHQISGLYRWLLKVSANRPTSPPSDLEPGGGSEEASLPEESS